jgi:LPXTG-motif cell wall-anchored protein
VYSNDDAPNSIAAGTDLDNGFGISTPVVSAAGEYATSFDLLFVGCLDGVEALQCINDNVNPAPAPAPDPELANTGASVAAPFGTGLAILLAGLAVVLVRRKGSRLTD